MKQLYISFFRKHDIIYTEETSNLRQVIKSSQKKRTITGVYISKASNDNRLIPDFYQVLFLFTKKNIEITQDPDMNIIQRY